MAREGFDSVTPLPISLKAEQSEKWSPHGAIAECIDNTFGPGRGDAGAVWITYDSKLRTLEILDGGKGMDAISSLFQQGKTVGRSIGDIGKYGKGGTKAILWLSSTVEIWTLRDGKMQHDKVRWSDWWNKESFDVLGVSNRWQPATLSNTPADLFQLRHGTKIKLHLLADRKFRTDHLTRDLAKTYSTGLRRGKRIIWTVKKNGQVMEDPRDLVDPFSHVSSADAETINFDIVVVHPETDEHLPVSGRVTLDEQTAQEDSRLYIGYGFRIILNTKECFKSPNGEERFAGTGVSGYLDLGEGWQDYLNTTKDGIKDDPLYERLMGYVFEQIKPLLLKARRNSFSIVFQDLALNFEQALKMRGGDVSVYVSETPRVESTEGGDWFPDPDGDQTVVPPDPMPALDKPLVDQPTDAPDGPKGESPPPPSTRIEIVPLSDHLIKRALCLAEISGDVSSVKLYINEDHETVQLALAAKPINRTALNMILVPEFAAELAAHPNSEKFIRRMFKAALANAIIGLGDPRARARLMTRALADCIRNPYEEAAE